MASGTKASRFEKTPRTRGRKWMEMRSLWLMQHPLCARCSEDGRVTLATEVDHILPLCKGGTDAPENLDSLCAEHHRAKTARDMGYRTAREIGVDGVPSDW